MPSVEEVKFHLNRLFSFILMFAVCCLLIALVIIVLIVRAASGNNSSNPSTPSTTSTNTLRKAISAALKEVMTTNEWDSIYYKWFNESKLTQQPSACLASEVAYPTRAGNLDVALNAGKIKWGFWLQEPWSVSKNPYTGCEVDLMKAITARIKTRYGVSTLNASLSDITVTSFFQDMKSKLESGEIDAVLSATTITSARAALVDFSCPYFATMVGLLRSSLNTPSVSIQGVEDLNKTSVSIVALKGSTLEQYILDKAPAANMVTVTTADALFAKVENNQVHIAVMDKSPLQYYMATRGKTKCASCKLIDVHLTTGDQYGIMTKKI